MSVLRCPQCQLPLTDEETSTGTCPICAAALPSAVSNQANATKPGPPAPGRSRIGPLMALAAVLLVFLAGGGYLLNALLREENTQQTANDREIDEAPKDKKLSAPKIAAEKIPAPKGIALEEAAQLTPELIPSPKVKGKPVQPPVVVAKPQPEKIPGPKIVLREKKEKVKEKDKKPPVIINGEVLVGASRKLNRPDGFYDLGVLTGQNKKLNLSGKVKTLHVPQVANGFNLKITNLAAEDLTFGRIENNNTKIKLSGKVKKLTIGSMGTGAVLDATQLEAEEIVFAGRLENWNTKVKLNGKVKTLRLDRINIGAVLEVLQLDAQEIIFNQRLDDHAKVTLSGKVKTLRVQEINTGVSFDASKLAAQEIIFTKRIDNRARVKLSAPGGVVEFRDRVDGGARLDVIAPGGKVTFTEPSNMGKAGSKIDGDAQVIVTAKKAEFRGIINGNNTRVTVTLTESGSLRFLEIAGNIRLQYRKAQPNNPDPVVEAGLVRGRAKVEKIQ